MVNHNFHPRHLPHVRETIGLDVWEELVNSPIGVVARLAERKSMWSGRTVHYLLCRQLRVIKKEIWCLVADEAIRFSLLEFGEITGLNIGPLPTEKFDPSQYNEFWGELKVPLGMGPKLDELKAALAFCPRWSFEKRKWLGLLLLQAMGVYCLHHNSRIPFQSAIRVLYDEAMRSYPWSRTAYEVLIDSIKTLAVDGGSYTISGMKDALLIWAYESVTCFGESFGRVINNEDVPLLRWGGKRTHASFDKLLSSEIEKHGEASPVVRTHQKSVNSPALVDATPRPKKNLAKELEKESGARVLLRVRKPMRRKKTAQADAAFKRKEKAEAKKKAAEEKKKEAEAKKTEATAKKKVAEAKKKVAELKKQSQARSTYKKVTPPRDGVTRCNVQPDVEDSSLADITDEVVAEQNEFAPKSDVENSELVRSAIIKEFWEKYVRLTSKGLSTTAVSSSFDFPTVGHDGTTCMRKNVTPSSAIYDPLAPDYPALLEKLMQHIKAISPKPPAPPGKKEVLTADHESDFYSILIHERPWPETEYGWVFDNHIVAYMNVLIKRSMREPTPFWSKRIAFVDGWWQSSLIHDYGQFKMKPTMFMFKGNGYEDMINGRIPNHCRTNLRWYDDVDHLYGYLQTGRNHWVTYHVDLKKEKIDCYDPIFGEVTPEIEQRILNSFKPLTHMIPAMLSVHIPANIRPISRKKFSFRRRSKIYTPQNTQIGDCGVYSLKFVECLALGVTFDGVNDQNIQGLRMKMAADILAEGGNIQMSSAWCT
ncbi:hypothetical protein BRARA_B02471 [Brassica rapa]|uniref:Ubiquitin-like protease family profile domain-containing protein n=1 Tax=Brassica campestris TaxID=3711 RepID=A0A398AD64_BRACM|nr:hypothetical protein BRARA_B02471 [Brassica rapa]